jgi:hypothetical protein
VSARTHPRAAARDIAILFGVVAALTLSFAHRPFHIDDDIYIKGAEQILREPWNPLGGTQRIFGEVMPTYHFTQHPPLLSYYIALVARVCGGMTEGALHLAFLVFPLAAAAALYALALRFTVEPLPAALLVVTTPVFVTLSHGLMTDLPFLAGSLGCAACFVYGVDRDRRGLVAAAGLLLAAACFVQYRGVLLVPLLAGYCLLQRRSLRPVVPLAAPAVLLLALWVLHTRRTLGVVHPLDAASWIELQWHRLGRDAAGYVAALGSGTLSPPLLLFAAHRLFRHPVPWAVILGATALVTIALTRGFPLATSGLYAFFFAAGAATVALLLEGGFLREWRRAGAGGVRTKTGADDLFLLMMFLVPVASQVVLNIFASTRSLLLGLPFGVLLFVRVLSREMEAGLRRTLWAGVALTAGGGLAVAVADLRFAQASREVAVAAGQHRDPAHRAWVTGEWGFRHYMEKEGFVPWTVGDVVEDGDVFIYPENACPAALPPDLVAALHQETTVAPRAASALKVTSFEAHAGFYSNFWGPLPFAVASGPLEQARIYRVRRPPPQ